MQKPNNSIELCNIQNIWYCENYGYFWQKLSTMKLINSKYTVYLLIGILGIGYLILSYFTGDDKQRIIGNTDLTVFLALYVLKTWFGKYID